MNVWKRVTLEASDHRSQVCHGASAPWAVRSEFFLPRVRTLASLLCLLAFPFAVCAADWPKWRGPNGDGIAAEPGLLRPWGTAGPAQLWQAEVHAGLSGLAISGGRLFTLGNVANEDRVQCLETSTGRTLWVHRYPAPLGANEYDGGPGATPVVDGRQLYALGKWGDLVCLDAASGRVVWSRRLATELNLVLPDWGLMGSPLVVGDRLYLNAGGRGLALDKRNGAVVWSNLEGANGYSGCVAYQHAGIPAVAFLGHREAVGVAQSDGEILMALLWRTPLDRSFPDPIPYEDGLLLCGSDLTAVFLQVQDRRATLRWINRELKPARSPGVIMGGHLYSFTGDVDIPGALVCVDMNEGSLRWKQEGLVPGSVIGVGGRLLVLDGQGALRIVAADPTRYREWARAQVLPPTRTWTPPSYANGVAYVRNAAGRVAALALPLTPLPTMVMGVVGNLVEVTWTSSPTNAVLEQALPSTTSPLLDWRAVPETSGVWTTNSYRTQPSERSALYRLRLPE